MAVPSASNYPTSLDSNATLFGDLINQMSFTLHSDIAAGDGSLVTDEAVSSLSLPVLLVFTDTGEIVLVTSKVDGTKTLNIERGVAGGASASSHTAGAVLRMSMLAEYLTQLKKAIVAIETELGVNPSGASADVTTRLAGVLPTAFTAAGQIPYASGSGAMALLAKPASSKQLMYWDTTTPAYLPIGGFGQRLATNGTIFGWSNDDAGLTLPCGNGIEVVGTGLQGCMRIGAASVVESFDIVADAAGSCVVDIRKCSYANIGSDTSICGTEKPTLSSAQKAQDTSLTTWTTTLDQGDYIYWYVESCTTCKWIAVSLQLQKVGF